MAFGRGLPQTTPRGSRARGGGEALARGFDGPVAARVALVVPLGHAHEGLDLVLREVFEGEADDVGEQRLLAAPDAARGHGDRVRRVDDGDGARGALGPPAMDHEPHAASGEVDELAAIAEQAADLDALGAAAFGGGRRGPATGSAGLRSGASGGRRGGGGASGHGSDNHRNRGAIARSMRLLNPGIGVGLCGVWWWCGEYPGRRDG